MAPEEAASLPRPLAHAGVRLSAYNNMQAFYQTLTFSTLRWESPGDPVGSSPPKSVPDKPKAHQGA